MYILFIMISLFGVISCLPIHKDHSSQVKWLKISDSKVVLEDDDYFSEYHLKLRVISVKGRFPKSLLSYSFSEHVSFDSEERGNEQVLTIIDQREKKLISYLINETDGKSIVDFAMPIFDFNFTDQYNQKQPLKLRNAKAKRLNANNFEIDCLAENETGDSEIRFSISLNRYKEIHEIDPNFVVRKGKEANRFGFGLLSDYRDNIQRLPTPKQGDKVVFFLENFPNDLHETSIQAVESWNDVFHMDWIKAVIGDPNDRKWGDRQYHVIQWIDLGPQSSLGNANYRFHDSKGEIYSGNIQMNASFYNKAIQRGQLNSDMVSYFTVSGLKIGNIDLISNEDSCSDFAYFPTSEEQDNLTYVQRAYHNTLVHEIGHVLGLNHNFKGSIKKVDQFKINSVMDYNPREFNTNHQLTPGPYDYAALHWAYFGDVPTQSFEYCIDKDVPLDWECNKFDWGNPISYLAQQTENFLTIFKYYDKPMKVNTDSFFELMVSFEKILAIWYKYKNIELPESFASIFKNNISPKIEGLLRLEDGQYKLAVYPEVQNLSLKYIDCLKSGRKKCKIMF